MTNIEKIQQKLNEFNIDAMLLTDSINRLYATGFSSSAGYVLVTAQDAWFVVDSRYSEAAQAAVSGAAVTPLPPNMRFEEKTAQLVADAGIKKLGFEDKRMTCYTYGKLSGMFDAELTPAQNLIDGLREVKSRAELEKMICAQRLAEKVFNDVLPLISRDMTEKELATEFIYRMHKNGAEKESFDPIVVSGTNSSRPHGMPQNEKLQKGFLTIDFGVCLDGYCSDTTRTLCIGEPSVDMVRVYDTVLRAQKAGIAAVRGGARGCDADSAARAVIEDAGFGEFFGHGFGHSLGLEIHESLSASPLSKDILPAGAVISAEPGIYIPGKYGVRIEDVVYVTEDGCENITNLSKDLMVI